MSYLQVYLINGYKSLENNNKRKINNNNNNEAIVIEPWSESHAALSY